MKLNKTCAIMADIKKRDGLLPLTARRPVSLLPFNGMYRMIDFPLSNIKDAKINSLFLIFNQGMTQSVIDHIGGGKEWDLNSLPNRFFMHFYQEANDLVDDDIHYYDSIIEYIEKSNSEFTLFIGNKMLFNMDFDELISYHKTHRKDITVAYKKMPTSEMTLDDLAIDQDNNHLVTNASICHLEPYNNEIKDLYMNVAVVNSEWLLAELKKRKTNDGLVRVEDIIREAMTKVRTWGYEYTGFLGNIHDIDSYYQANMDMLEVANYSSLFDEDKTVYMKNIDEVPTFHASSSDVTHSQVASGCLIYGKVHHSILSTKTKICEDAKVSHSILMSKTIVNQGATVEYAILDKNVVVDAGVRIIGTPDNPIVIKKNTHVTKDMVQREETIDERIILCS